MEDLLSPKQLCEKWGISMSTLYLRMNEADFPDKIKIGHATRFRVSEIVEYEDAHQQTESSIPA